MKFTILTLFPEMFPGILEHSLAGKALRKNLWQIETVDIKQFGVGKHQQIDDTPYGGGAGMVMRADVLAGAIDSVKERVKKLIYMSPRGKTLTQQKAGELAREGDMAIICGRYEGIDERVIEHYDIEEISIGDYILSGGEPAALILMDAIIRLLPEVIGNSETHNEESFSSGLLEYPHYTKPAEWQGHKVPEVLISGDHKKIRQWREEKAREITSSRRPDLLVPADKTTIDKF